MLNGIGANRVLSQVSADKLDSITAFPKFFSQTSYTKLVSYRRAIFQALEASLRSMCVWWRQVYRTVCVSTPAVLTHTEPDGGAARAR